MRLFISINLVNLPHLQFFTRLFSFPVLFTLFLSGFCSKTLKMSFSKQVNLYRILDVFPCYTWKNSMEPVHFFLVRYLRIRCDFCSFKTKSNNKKLCSKSSHPCVFKSALGVYKQNRCRYQNRSDCNKCSGACDNDDVTLFDWLYVGTMTCKIESGQDKATCNLKRRSYEFRCKQTQLQYRVR